MGVFLMNEPNKPFRGPNQKVEHLTCIASQGTFNCSEMNHIIFQLLLHTLVSIANNFRTVIQFSTKYIIALVIPRLTS